MKAQETNVLIANRIDMKQPDSGKRDLRVADEAATKGQQVAGAGSVEDEVARARLDKRREAVRRRCAAVIEFRRLGLTSESSDVLPPLPRLLTPEELDEIDAHGF